MMYRLINRISNLKSVIILFLMFSVMYVLINGNPFGLEELKDISGGVGILDVEFNYSVEEAYNLLDSLGEDGRLFYRSLIINLDFLFPLSYSLFFAVAICYLGRIVIIHDVIRRIVTIIPLFGGLLDMSENVMVLYVLREYPDRLITLIKLMNIVTMIKSVLSIMSLTSLIGLLIITIIKRHKKVNPEKAES